MVKRVIRFVSTLVAGFLLMAALLYHFQEYLIFPGVQLPPSGGNYKLMPGVRTTTIKTADGETLKAFTSIQEGESPEFVGLIFHGNAETAESQNFIPFFRKVGIPALTFDYRGYRDSTGWPSEQGLYLDAEAAAARVQELTGLPYSRFVLLGNSIGAGPASYLAQKIQPRALILLAGFHHFEDLVAAQPLYNLFRFALRYQFPVGRYLQGLSEQCVILAHGQRDEIIPFMHLAKLQRSVPPSVKLKLLESDVAHHNNIFYKVEDQLIHSTKDCLQ